MFGPRLGWHLGARADAMLELFQVNWPDLIQKMPEIAEAGYTSLWLPPPAKGSSVFSVGYDLFDPSIWATKISGALPRRNTAPRIN